MIKNIYDRVGQYGLYGLLEGSDRQGNGNTWFVDSTSGNAANTGASGQGESWDLPFSTINYAVSQCTNQGEDVILVAANHVETIQDTSPLNESGTVTDELCIDKSGVTIIGMGVGTARPTITLSGATDATVEIRAANVTIKNFIIVSGLADVAAGISITNSADGTLIENIEFRDGGTNVLELVLGVSIAANCDDTTIRGCQFYTTATGSSTNAAIKTAGAAVRLKIQDNYCHGDWNAAVFDLDAAATTSLLVANNVINNLDATVGSGIDCHGSSTGAVIDNLVHAPDGSAASQIIAGGCLVAGNLATADEGVTASPINAGGGGAGSGGVELGTGRKFYVDAGTGNATNDGTSWQNAVDTIDVAVGLCTASRGDIIYVAQGHTETLTGATTFICDIDVAGISIIGMGTGENRPIIKCNTVTDGVVELTADDVLLENIIFQASADDMEYLVRVSGDNVTIRNCRFMEDDEQPLSCITVGIADNDCDDLLIENCSFYIPTADDANSAIDIVKDMANITIKGCNFRGDWDDAVIDVDAGGDACTNLQILDNVMINQLTGQHCIQISGVTVTGLIAGNTFVSDTRDQVAQPSLCQMVNNKWSKLGTGQVGIDNQDPVNAGIHLYVDSGATGAADTAGHGYSWDEPLATIDAAVNLVTASSGDVIHVAPGHAETIATPSAITIDVVGVTIIGHGVGTDRPTITFDTGTDTTWVVSAANFYIENCIFINTQDALVVGFPVTAANATFKNCVFRDDGTDNTLDWITASSAADYLTLIDCVNEGTDTAGNNSWVQLDGMTNFTMRGCVSNGDFAVANVGIVNTACTEVLIDRCHFENANAIDVNVELFAASTGWISNCSMRIATDAQTTWVNTPGNAGIFECYGVNNNGEAGKFVGTVSV
jgi:hypothetical protein